MTTIFPNSSLCSSGAGGVWGGTGCTEDCDCGVDAGDAGAGGGNDAGAEDDGIEEDVVVAGDDEPSLGACGLITRDGLCCGIAAVGNRKSSDLDRPAPIFVMTSLNL